MEEKKRFFSGYLVQKIRSLLRVKARRIKLPNWNKQITLLEKKYQEAQTKTTTRQTTSRSASKMTQTEQQLQTLQDQIKIKQRLITLLKQNNPDFFPKQKTSHHSYHSQESISQDPPLQSSNESRSRVSQKQEQQPTPVKSDALEVSFCFRRRNRTSS